MTKAKVLPVLISEMFVDERGVSHGGESAPPWQEKDFPFDKGSRSCGWENKHTWTCRGCLRVVCYCAGHDNDTKACATRCDECCTCREEIR